VRASNLRLFLVGGLLVAVGLGLFVSGFASPAPDGLNKVAEDNGFAAKARQHLFENGPLAGYAVKGVDNQRLGKGLSGLIGVLVTFGVGLTLFALLRATRSGRDPSEPTRAP
jgi:cobalt/nickel transport system permease protein